MIKYRPLGYRESASRLQPAYNQKKEKAYRLAGQSTEDIKIDRSPPSGSRQPTGHIDFRPLVWTSYDAPGSGKPIGWDRLADTARWVRGHLVNGKWGGPGGKLGVWNLVPIPEISNADMSAGHEGTIHPLVRAGRYIWFSIDIVYHKDNESSQIGHASDYPKHITVQYWEATKQGNSWVKGAALGGQSYIIRLPGTDEIKPERRLQ